MFDITTLTSVAFSALLKTQRFQRP